MAAAFRPDNDNDNDSAHPLELMLREVTIEREHLAPGTAIGSFVLRRVVERDDFGLLYLATASASGMEVAIEEYLPAALATRGDDGTLRPRSDAQAELLAAGLQAFLQESDQLSRLSHPALMRIGPVWQTRGTAFRLRLDLPGSTLAVLRAGQRTPPAETWLRDLALPLLGALDRLHGVGLLHGNVRPGRIMIQPDGAPLLMDFGAAREAITAVAPWLGAPLEPEYRAPELLDARQRIDAGPPADLYALAAVLRYCITGEAPVAAKRRCEGERLPRLADLLPSLQQRHAQANYSDSLVAAIDRAMALDPAQRPQTAAEFRAELERMPPAQPVAAATAPRAPAAVIPAAEAIVRAAPVATAPIEVPEPAESVPTLHPLQAAARAALQAEAAAALPALDDDEPDDRQPLNPLQAVALQERQRQQRQAGRGASPALRDEPAFDFPLEPEPPARVEFSTDLMLDPPRGREPHFAPVAAPGLDWSRHQRPASQPWTWALGGLLVGALLTVAVVVGVRRDDARLAWAAISASLPSVSSEASPEPARLPPPPTTATTEIATAPSAAAAASGPVAATSLPPLNPAAGPAQGSTTDFGAAAPPAVAAASATTLPATPEERQAVGGRQDAASADTTGAASKPPATQAAAVPRAAPAPAPARSTVAPARTANADPPPQQRAPARVAEPPPERATVAERPRQQQPLVSPAAACAPRSNFSLYQCMKAKCSEDAYYTHPQCIRLRRTDEVS